MMRARTKAYTQIIIVLGVLANAWQFNLHWHTNLIEDVLSTEPRELKDLRCLQRASSYHAHSVR